MSFKVICFAALVAVASAQYNNAYPATAYKAQPAAYKPASYATAYKQEYEQPAEYSFTYDVNNAQTYDVKSQSESLKDGYTVGQYSLIDADGLRRTVDYTADDYNGFQATVRREAVGQAYEAPKYQAPAYSAPRYEAPRYQAKAAPKYQAPAYQAPRYEAPKYQAPAYNAPRYETPRYQAKAAPAYQAPRYEAPKYQAKIASAYSAPTVYSTASY